ncbi:helix-turn-helix transcriptional regulator [Hyphomonas sp.]|uniref:helix-turn-helix domain-containing protein n=1 Tax=Hyphomonas sp. TaxID=87 RepID=UPI0025B85EE6|nr:helix-turn-helix transcriptional regulator [Hyphomonas sp.]
MKKTGKKRANRKAVSADLVVGSKVRQLRADAGLTLSELAEALGISHQQLQKYETGANRISAGMLYELARFFVIPVDQLFEGSDAEISEDVELIRARRKCHAVVDRTDSKLKLEGMAKVLRAMSGD